MDRHTHGFKITYTAPSYTQPENYTCTQNTHAQADRRTHTETLRNTRVDIASTHPENHTLKYTVDIHGQQAGRQTDTLQHRCTETLTYTSPTHVHPDARKTRKRARAHTAQEHAHSRPQRLSLPQDSAQGLGGKGRSNNGPPSGTLLASFPRETHLDD